MADTFKALVVEKNADGSYQRSVKERSTAELPHHDVLINVHYSALNYKDALSAIGNEGITQQFPYTPGIDAAGVIAESKDNRFSSGEKVIVTSFDLGQNTDGGFGEYICVPGDWIVPLPSNMSLKESMRLGTSGFTAAYGVHHLISNKIQPGDGPILVTGATGGVGSFAITLLSLNNFEVTAATGKMDQRSYLQSLGASQVIPRNEITDDLGKPLLSGRWAGVIDTVGGSMLDVAIRQTKHNGVVACCGNILGGDLNTSIYPFILRGVSLMGIDSGMCLMPMRKKIWDCLATDWKLTNLAQICRECSLDELDSEIDKMLAGSQVGKVVINLKKSVNGS